MTELETAVKGKILLLMNLGIIYFRKLALCSLKEKIQRGSKEDNVKLNPSRRGKSCRVLFQEVFGN